MITCHLRAFKLCQHDLTALCTSKMLVACNLSAVSVWPVCDKVCTAHVVISICRMQTVSTCDVSVCDRVGFALHICNQRCRAWTVSACDVSFESVGFALQGQKSLGPKQGSYIPPRTMSKGKSGGSGALTKGTSNVVALDASAKK